MPTPATLRPGCRWQGTSTTNTLWLSQSHGWNTRMFAIGGAVKAYQEPIRVREQPRQRRGRRQREAGRGRPASTRRPATARSPSPSRAGTQRCQRAWRTALLEEQLGQRDEDPGATDTATGSGGGHEWRDRWQASMVARCARGRRPTTAPAVTNASDRRAVFPTEHEGQPQERQRHPVQEGALRHEEAIEDVLPIGMAAPHRPAGSKADQRSGSPLPPWIMTSQPMDPPSTNSVSATLATTESPVRHHAKAKIRRTATSEKARL